MSAWHALVNAPDAGEDADDARDVSVMCIWLLRVAAHACLSLRV